MVGNEGHTSKKGRARGAVPPGRAGQPVTEDDRPFSDIRKRLQDALRILSVHRWAFFVPSCLAACATFLLSLYYPRTYSASTIFERRNDPVMIDLPISAGAASFNYFRSTMQSDLTSSATMVEVVDRLGLTKDFPRNDDGSLTKASLRQREAIGRSLGSKLTIGRTSPSEHIDVISITYTGPDPLIGPRLVDEVKKTYIKRTMQWIHQFLISQRDYFMAEADEALEELRRAQREDTVMRLEKPYANPQDPGALSTKIAQLEIERRELLLRRREYNAELAAQRQMLASLEPQIAATPDDGRQPNRPDPLSADALRIRTKIQELTAQVEQLRAARGMTDEHPEIQERLAIRRQLDAAFEMQRVADREAAESAALQPVAMPLVVPYADSGLQQWHTERARLVVLTAAQESKIADVDISLESNEFAMAQLLKAKADIFQNQEEFDEVLSKVAKARQRHGSFQTTLTAIEPAIKAIEQDRLMQFSEGPPARGTTIPISPKANIIVLLAALAGLAAGVGFVILAEVLDHVYRSSGHVSRSLGLPILEAIDEIVTTSDRRRFTLRRAVLAPILVVGLLTATGTSGSMAYLSIERPGTLQQIRRIPELATRWLT